MKKAKSLFLLVLLVILFCGCAKQESARESGAHVPAPGERGLTVTFPFQRQSGFSSNQFAVWVEDAEGRLVKTLYATNFTAKGGWKKRPEALPVWVGLADLQNQPAETLEGIAGATPKSGNFSCYWDCVGMDGRPVPEGIYHIFVEGTLRGKSRVLYSAEINLGTEATQTTAEAAYFGNAEKERGMLGMVTVQYYPLAGIPGQNTFIPERNVFTNPSMHQHWEGHSLFKGWIVNS